MEHNGIVHEITTVIKAKSKELGWLGQAADMLFAIARMLKKFEDEKEEATRTLKIKYDLASKPYLDAAKAIKVKDKELRDAVLENYKGHESIVTENGEVIFKRPWTYVVADMAQVPDEYLTVDNVKVANAIKDGLRNIPGLSIFQTRTLTVTPVKETNATARNSVA
jgi:hypothetical protein